ncbi:MAG: hypothetical protein A2Y90_04475 [Chloroflexi bacterium RBG_13_52_12]|nr:MAG: hypothetical protein A2Y90_04475 [Chloroflexi bacterium RBG_13_52_12]
MNNPEEKEVYQLEIPVKLDVEAVVKRLKIGRMSDRLDGMALELAETAQKIARPRAVYQVSHSHLINGNRVDIDGVIFTSKVLSKLLKGRDTVIPFIATIGKELDELPVSRGDMMRNFCLDSIKTVVLVNAVDYLSGYVKEKHNMPRAALMNPGEIEDWRITEQRPLFSLFKDAAARIGVTLTPGGVMKPIKSRSGIIFPDETGFVSCQLCTQVKCPGRRAKYDPELVKEYLG